MTRPRTVRSAVLTAAVALALSSCSTHPGSAAVVGSQGISDSRLDRVSEALCTAQQRVQTAQGGQAQPVSSASARRQALGLIVDSELNAQYAKAKGVRTNPAQVSAAMSSYDQILGSVPAMNRGVLRSTLLAYTKGQLVDLAVGRAALAAQGGAGPAPTAQQAVTAGARVRSTWTRKHVKVSVNPRYGSYKSGALVATSGGSLSAPVSAAAKASAKASPSATDVAGLPASQTCGA